MTSQKAPVFCALLLSVIALDVGFACSSTETTLPPPPGTSSSHSSSSSSGAGGMGGEDGGSDAGDAGDANLCMGDAGQTGMDCGGPNCPPCGTGQGCLVKTDCQSLDCSGGSCLAPTCTDHIQNEGETDIDCGGPSCPPCDPGQHCLQATDCTSMVCTATTGLCAVPTCSDGVQNQGESDIDCGGPCPPCNPGKKCNTAADCIGMQCSGGRCQCPTGMVVSPITTGGIYCIDATEVTYDQYQIFYAANPPVDQQVPECMWNTDWTPSAEWPQPTMTQFYPVAYVNWCQAYAYCHYNSKRLCGLVVPQKDASGAMITNVPTSELTTIADDQWFNACTAQGANTYPYGNLFMPGECNGLGTYDAGVDGTWSQSMVMSCLGGVPGLFDMSGNVAEWEDSCDGMTGDMDMCMTRGGSYEDGEAQLTCATAAPLTRDYQGPDVGFRCCL